MSISPPVRLMIDEALVYAGALGEVSVIDTDGALTLAALDAGATRIRVHQDSLADERALTAALAERGASAMVQQCDLDPALTEAAELVLAWLPKSLAALDEIAQLVASHANESVRMIAGGRVKHMSLGQNATLAESFGTVRASLARQKSRALHAFEPVAAPQRWPQQAHHSDVQGVQSLRLFAHGAAFAGTAVDIGTRALLDVLHEAPPARRAIDLACGTGALATALALQQPDVLVIASDISAAAVASATQTVRANKVADRVSVVRDIGLASQPSASAELILLNPPFHSGTSVDTTLANTLFRDAERVLVPGGELWCVWNSHLRYRHQLESRVGPTRQLARTTKFTVTASTKR